MDLRVGSGKMVDFGLEGNGFLCRRFSGGLARSLRLHMPGKRVSLIVRGPSGICCSAPSNGERRTQSVMEEVIENELKFKPIFDDYVKVMESVSIDRSNYSRPDAKGRRLARRSSRNFGKGKILCDRRVDKELKDSDDGNFGIRSSTIEEKDNNGNCSGKLGNRSAECGQRNGERRSSDLQRAKISSILRRQNETIKTGKNKKPINKFESSIVGVGTVGEHRHHGYNSEVQIRSRSLKPLRGLLKEQSRGSSEDRSMHEIIDTHSISKDKVVYQGKNGRNLKQHVPSKGILQRSIRRKCSENVSEKDVYHEIHTRKKQHESEMCDSIIGIESCTESKSGRNLRNSEIDIPEIGSGGKEEIGSATHFNLKGWEKSSSNGNSYSPSNVHGHSRSYQELNHESTVGTGHVSKAVGSDRRFSKSGKQADVLLDEEVDHVDLEERDAFKTFEVFTDVRNRPRVLRMEMEERIRNLAKWLNATDINMPEWKFSKMMHSAKIKFTDHSILRVVQILGEFGNWRRVLQIVEWLQSQERFKSYKSKYIYTAALNVLGKAKRPMEALNIFYAMLQEKASYPDLAAYHCISVALGQAGRMKELFDVIDCMRTYPKRKFNLGLDQKWDPRLEPDLVVYNAVLNACVQRKQWEGAFWVLQQLKQQFIRPSSTTYGLVMEVMLACGKYDLVHEFFKKVEATTIPSTLSYKVIVNTFWREGKIDAAVLAVQDMERRGVVGSASVYYDLARCLCSAGRCQEALLQIDKICKVAKKPLVVTYTGLIQACIDSGSIENGIYVFNQMCRVCSPNIVTCNIMLKSYLEHRMYANARDFFQKILDGSHDIKSNADLKGKVVPDKFTFNTMMDASIAAGNWDDFENIYLQMLHHGFHFDKKRHLRMVMDAARAGKVKVLETTWEYLVGSGRDLPPPIIKEKFQLKLKNDDCAAAISCLTVQQAYEPHPFSRESWLNLLKFNSDNFEKDTIFRLIHEMDNLVAGKDEPLSHLQNLLDACIIFLGPPSAATTSHFDD